MFTHNCTTSFPVILVPEVGDYNVLSVEGRNRVPKGQNCDDCRTRSIKKRHSPMHPRYVTSCKLSQESKMYDPHHRQGGHHCWFLQRSVRVSPTFQLGGVSTFSDESSFCVISHGSYLCFLCIRDMYGSSFQFVLSSTYLILRFHLIVHDSKFVQSTRIQSDSLPPSSGSFDKVSSVCKLLIFRTTLFGPSPLSYSFRFPEGPSRLSNLSVCTP